MLSYKFNVAVSKACSLALSVSSAACCICSMHILRASLSPFLASNTIFRAIVSPTVRFTPFRSARLCTVSISVRAPFLSGVERIWSRNLFMSDFLLIAAFAAFAPFFAAAAPVPFLPGVNGVPFLRLARLFGFCPLGIRFTSYSSSFTYSSL